VTYASISGPFNIGFFVDVIAHLSIFILVLYLSEFKVNRGRLGGSRAGASVIVASCYGGGSDVWWTSKVGAVVGSGR
jgi:hypothetical protein